MTFLTRASESSLPAPHPTEGLRCVLRESYASLASIIVSGVTEKYNRVYCGPHWYGGKALFL